MEDKTTPLPISEDLSRKITSLAAGEAHTIALTGDGCVYSWGRGMFGRIGTGRETDELVPARVEFDSPAARIVGIAAGAYHSLAVSDDGSVWCWGYNIYGQLGFDGENTLAPRLIQNFFEQEASSSSPDDSGREARSDLKVCAVKAGSMMSLAIDNAGGLWMWGNVPPQETGPEPRLSFTSVPIPFPIPEFNGRTVLKVACGDEHVVALVGSKEIQEPALYSWGNNHHGQLGLGDGEGRARPQVVETFNQNSGLTVYDIACGAHHTALLTYKKDAPEGPSVCWTFGFGENGQLGRGSTKSSPVPEPVSELPEHAHLVSVDCGLFHTSVVSSDFVFFGLISLQLPPLSTQQATESCSSTLPLNDLTFDSTLLQCVEAWTPQNYILRYAKTVDNTWSFILSAPDSSAYIGIGFSTNGQMTGASAVVGWIPTDGRGQAKQYLLGGKSPGEVKPDQGDLNIVNGSLKIESVSSRLYMSFQLTAELPRQILLYAMGPAGFIPASPGFSLREHRDMTTTTINYNTGSQSVVKGSPHSKLRKTHGLMNMFGWGILIIIGALVARHMKQWQPTWFYAHIALQTTGFLLGLTGIICGLVLENRTDANNVSKHKGLGITIFVMGILQVLALLARPDKDSKYRKYWNWYHHNVGRVMIILAISNIFYGIHLADAGSSWNGGYGFVVAVLASAAIGLEVIKFRNK